jgi:hypothetical protein
MAFSKMILGFIVSKKGKLPVPKKIQVIVQIDALPSSLIDSNVNLK